jgi:membrane protein YqaA with SNARE-associated domain
MLGLIPFVGPSDLLIASNAALLVKADPFSLGFLVALGSASAKLVHYIATFFLGNFLSEKRRKNIDAVSLRVKKWAFLGLFVACATPIPDEPVIIPLGLMKYNPAKFYLAAFLGKVSITVVGAYLGIMGGGFLFSFISNGVFIVLSIILTIAVTIMLLKIDLGKIAERMLRRTKKQKQ